MAIDMSRKLSERTQSLVDGAPSLTFLFPEDDSFLWRTSSGLDLMSHEWLSRYHRKLGRGRDWWLADGRHLCLWCWWRCRLIFQVSEDSELWVGLQMGGRKEIVSRVNYMYDYSRLCKIFEEKKCKLTTEDELKVFLNVFIHRNTGQKW